MNKKSLMKGVIVTGLTGVVVFALIAGVFVGCGNRSYRSEPQDSGKHIGWVSKKITDRLELTADQKASLEEMITEIHEKREEGRTWRKSAKQDVISLVRQEQIAQMDIDRLVDTHRQHMEKVVAFLSDRVIKFHALLTPEQRDKLANEIERHEPGHWRSCRYKKW